MKEELVQHNFQITREMKELRNSHKGAVFWLTGLSGSGKSTIADLTEKILFSRDKQTIILDGDTVRNGLCKGLGFTEDGRTENLRRVSETAKILAENGTIVLCCFISPLKIQRDMISEILGNNLYLIHVDANLTTCEERDPKGLYKKARSGEIKNFTGITSKYEEPSNPKLKISTSHGSPEADSKTLADFIELATKLD